MQRLQTIMSSLIVLSELTHIFCCGLPSVFSGLALLSAIGITIMPAGLSDLHDVLHNLEIPMLIFSGIMLALGWSLHGVSKKLDCRRDGMCQHEPCAPKKKHSGKVLKVATLLFVVNMAIYFGLHRGHAPEISSHAQPEQVKVHAH